MTFKFKKSNVLHFANFRDSLLLGSMIPRNDVTCRAAWLLLTKIPLLGVPAAAASALTGALTGGFYAYSLRNYTYRHVLVTRDQRLVQVIGFRGDVF